MPDRSAPEPIALVVVNTRFRTADPHRPWADALAVRGGRIVEMGSSAALRKLAAGARVLDGRGGTLRPAAGDAPDADPLPVARGDVADFVLLERPPADGIPPRLVAVVTGGVIREP